MTATAFANLCKVTTPTVGAGASLELGDAVEGFQGAGVLTDGETYNYNIAGSGGLEEGGSGAWDEATQTIVRNVYFSSAGGSRVSLVGGETVVVGTILAEDLGLILAAPVVRLNASASAAANAAVLAAAIAALPATTFPDTGPPLVLPPGDYDITSFPTLAATNITILGWGCRLNCTGSIALDLGADAYITDYNEGYYNVTVKGLCMALAGAATGIRNRGIRRLMLEQVTIVDGATALDTEGAFAGAVIDTCRFHSQSSHAAHIRQGNNLMVFRETQFLAAGGRGTLIDSTSFGAAVSGNNAVMFDHCDWEGCAGAVLVEGLVTNLVFETPWFESNTVYNVTIDNATGSANKYGITFRNVEGAGAGVDFLIGTDASAGTSINGFSWIGGALTDSDLVFLSGAPIFNAYILPPNLGGTSVITVPAQGLSGSGIGVSQFMPMYHDAPTAPTGTTDAGWLGDMRAVANRLWHKTASGWMTSQLDTVSSATTPSALPTGATPSVAGLGFCTTNNGGATSVTDLLNGFIGQQVTICGLDGGNTTLVDGGNLHLAGNFTLGDWDTITLRCAFTVTGTLNWAEVCRSNN